MMTEAKTMAELATEYPGLRFEVVYDKSPEDVTQWRQFRACYQGDVVPPVLQSRKDGKSAWPQEAEAVAILADRLDALRKALTPVGEVCDLRIGDAVFGPLNHWSVGVVARRVDQFSGSRCEVNYRVPGGHCICLMPDGCRRATRKEMEELAGSNWREKLDIPDGIDIRFKEDVERR